MAHRGVLGLATLVLVVACSPTSTASPGASSPGGAFGQDGLAGCAWPDEADAYSSNALLLDTSAAYWIDRFTVTPGLRIVVSGTFPDARYASLEVYTTNGSPFTRNGVGSTLTDYQIAPDQGSVNPWQHQAAPGGRYTVTLREDVEPGQANTIPIAPAGLTSGLGLIVYRVYLAAGGDISKVALPTLTLQQGDQSATLAPCPAAGSALTAPRPSTGPVPTPTETPAPSASTQPVGQLQFFRDVIGTLAPNVDTPYVMAYLSPPGPGDVVVVHGRAPTHAAGDHPSPWPMAGEDVRYWSLCSGLVTGVLPTVMNLGPSGGIDPGCRADDQVKLDSAGSYAFVLGTEAQRATIEGVPGATFLPISAAQPATTHLLMFRYTLIGSSFANSPGNVTSTNDPAATEAAMGAYYPRGAVCTLSTLVSGGLTGCLK